MNAQDVIESYVRDVARFLRRDARNDVAMELRALLHDELAARAATLGTVPDRTMAMEVLAAFGRPAAVATRYRSRDPLVEPEDNHSFLIYAVAGALGTAVLGGDGGDVMGWIGTVFVLFAIVGWARRRAPAERFTWTPTAPDKPARGGRWPALAAALGMAVFPLAMYLAPQGFWETATFGKGVSGGLELTPEFLGSWQRMATVGWLVLVIANYAVVAVQNGWRRWNRYLSLVAHIGLGLMLMAHAAPLETLLQHQPLSIFVAPLADALARPWFALAGAITIACTLYEMYREWVRVEPAPAASAVSPDATAAG